MVVCACVNHLDKCNFIHDGKAFSHLGRHCRSFENYSHIIFFIKEFAQIQELETR